MAGRAKPKTQKKLEGNQSNRPIPITLNLPPAIPVMPEWLPPIAVAEWERVVPVLDQAGVLKAVDGAALADYCLCLARLQECEEEVTQHGILVSSRNRATGGAEGPARVKNPAVQIGRQYRASVQKYVELFGFAPGPRNRIAMPDGKDEDDELMD